jgi:hypothetical protein
MNNNSITEINNLLKTFIDDPTSLSISVTKYNDLSMELVHLKQNVPTSSALHHIISTFISILDSLHEVSNLNLSLQGANNLAGKYQNDSIILNDVSLLQEYINGLKKAMNIFGTITVNSVETPVIKEPYNTYHTLYGIPSNLEYDPDKLLNIKQSLNL